VASGASNDETLPVKIDLLDPVPHGGKDLIFHIGEDVSFKWRIKLDVAQEPDCTLTVATDPLFEPDSIVYYTEIKDTNKSFDVKWDLDGSVFDDEMQQYFWNVTWTYEFYTTNATYKVVATSSLGRFKYGDSPPTLTIPEDAPVSGDTNDDFEFIIVYQDLEQKVPDYLYLYIADASESDDPPPIQADLLDVEYEIDGLTFTFPSKELDDDGTYEYYFEASDPAGNVVESDVKVLEVEKGEETSSSFFGDTTTVLCTITFITILVMFITAMVIFRRRTSEDVESDLGWDKQQKEGRKAFTCSECGAKVPANSDSCPKCGEDFEGEEFECPTCQTEVSEDSTKCPKCGTTFQDLDGSSVTPSSQHKGKGGLPKDKDNVISRQSKGSHDKKESAKRVGPKATKGTDDLSGSEFICSICGAKVKGKSKKCSNCGMEFD